MVLKNVTQTVTVTTIVTAVAFAGALLYKRWKKQKIPTNWELIGFVKKVYLYPLKSGNRIELEKVECTDVGFRQIQENEKIHRLRDRELMVYNAKDNEFRTARTYPKMLLIDVTIHDDDHLAIDAPTMRTLYVKLPSKDQNNVTKIKSWYDEKIFAIDCGEEAATWFSRYIVERDSGLRLAYHDVSQRRDISKSHQKLTSFYKLLDSQSTGLYHDLSAVMIINQKSVNDLNERLSNSPININNFRPNIIVDGKDLKPYDEDSWDWLKVGDEVILRNVKECTRCVMTTIDAETAIRNPNREPLKTLSAYRPSTGPEKDPVMGINLGVRQPGFIKAGDPIYIVRKQ